MPKRDYFATRAAVVSILPCDVRSATCYSDDIDIRGLDENALFILDCDAQGSGATSTIKLQQSPELAVGPAQDDVGATDIALRTAADANVLLGGSVTPAASATIKKIGLPLKMKGTLAAGDVWVTILADSSGPTGSALGTSAKIAASAIGAAYGVHWFTFATPVNVTAATKYWIVLQGDYTAGSTNQILWRSNTVASGGNSATNNGSAWSAVATEDMEFATRQLVFADVTGGGFTAVVNAASMQKMAINLTGLGPYLRAVDTIAGTVTGATSLHMVAMPE